MKIRVNIIVLPIRFCVESGGTTQPLGMFSGCAGWLSTQFALKREHSLLIEWLLFNIKWTIFEMYSWRENKVLWVTSDPLTCTIYTSDPLTCTI